MEIVFSFMPIYLEKASFFVTGETFDKTESMIYLQFAKCNSLPKTIEVFLRSFERAVVETVRVRINAILFIFFEVDVRSFEIRITA